jgi:hypothetical protein
LTLFVAIASSSPAFGEEACPPAEPQTADPLAPPVEIVAQVAAPSLIASLRFDVTKPKVELC